MLLPGGKPLSAEPYLLIEWRDADGLSIEKISKSFRYRVGPRSWNFWLEEGPRVAERYGLEAIYYLPPTDAQVLAAQRNELDRAALRRK